MELNGIMKDFLLNADIIMLHVGTNDISLDGNVEKFKGNFENTVKTLKSLNRGAKLLVSSISPGKYGRVVNNIINKANKNLYVLTLRYTFLNNDAFMIENDKPNNLFVL